MMRIMIACSLALGMVACGAGSQTSDSTTPTQAANSNENEICHEEAPTGSNITHTVCRTREQSAQEREAAQKALREPRPVPKTGD